jgi:ABC-type sugar transport system substrate-binding protein
MLVAAGLGAFAAYGATASKASTHRAAASQSIIFSVYSNAPLFIQRSITGLNRAAKAHGWDFSALSGDNTPSTQTSQIQTAITKRPTAIIVWANNAQAQVPISKQAASSGIKVVTDGQDFSDTSARSFFFGAQPPALGTAKAKALVKILHGKGQIAIIRGIKGAFFTDGQAQGGDAVFKKYPGIKVVQTLYANAYTSGAGFTSTQNIITAHPGIKGLWVDDDDIAVGAAKALQARGLLKKVAIVSTNGDAALPLIRKGQVRFTSALCPSNDGVRVMNALAKLFAGQPVPSYVAPKIVGITPQNIKKYSKYLASCAK